MYCTVVLYLFSSEATLVKQAAGGTELRIVGKDSCCKVGSGALFGAWFNKRLSFWEDRTSWSDNLGLGPLFKIRGGCFLSFLGLTLISWRFFETVAWVSGAIVSMEACFSFLSCWLWQDLQRNGNMFVQTEILILK